MPKNAPGVKGFFEPEKKIVICVMFGLLIGHNFLCVCTCWTEERKRKRKEKNRLRNTSDLRTEVHVYYSKKTCNIYIKFRLRSINVFISYFNYTITGLLKKHLDVISYKDAWTHKAKDFKNYSKNLFWLVITYWQNSLEKT